MANSLKATQPRKHGSTNNPIENGSTSFGDFPREIGKNVKQNLAAMPDDFFSQLLGLGNFEQSTTSETSSANQEMKPGQEFTLAKRSVAKEQPKPERRPAIAAGIDYHAEIVRGNERATKRETQEIQYQIQQIMDELQRLVASSDKIIQMTYGEVSVASAPKIVGKYHTNFFSWMLTVIRTARQKVEDSGAWLSVAKGKGSKKGYWNMFKKHGTTFGMSNERTVATQTG